MISLRKDDVDLIDEIEKLLLNPQSSAQRQRVVSSVGGLTKYQLKPNHSHEAYARTVLYSTPALEVMVASWTQFQECLPHDHGSSNGMVINLIGQFEETSYRWLDGLLVRRHSVLHNIENSLLEVSVANIHSMHCKNPGGLTLHIYAPAIDGMKVFDMNLRRTLTVANNCGAWVPLNPAQVINEIHWNRPNSNI